MQIQIEATLLTPTAGCAKIDVQMVEDVGIYWGVRALGASRCTAGGEPKPAGRKEEFTERFSV
jgi:hypothetical protein